MKRVSERRAHDVVDGEVDRGVEHLQEPDKRRHVQEPHGEGQHVVRAAHHGVVHGHGLEAGREKR